MSSPQHCGKSLGVPAPHLGPGVYQLHDLGLEPNSYMNAADVASFGKPRLASRVQAG